MGGKVDVELVLIEQRAKAKRDAAVLFSGRFIRFFLRFFARPKATGVQEKATRGTSTSLESYSRGSEPRVKEDAPSRSSRLLFLSPRSDGSEKKKKKESSKIYRKKHVTAIHDNSLPPSSSPPNPNLPFHPHPLHTQQPIPLLSLSLPTTTTTTTPTPRQPLHPNPHLRLPLHPRQSTPLHQYLPNKVTQLVGSQDLEREIFEVC